MLPHGLALTVVKGLAMGRIMLGLLDLVGGKEVMGRTALVKAREGDTGGNSGILGCEGVAGLYLRRHNMEFDSYLCGDGKSMVYFCVFCV